MKKLLLIIGVGLLAGCGGGSIEGQVEYGMCLSDYACDPGYICVDHLCVPVQGCADGQAECQGACCQEGEVCLAGGCCRAEKICGDQCCGGAESCWDGVCNACSQPLCGGECCFEGFECNAGQCCAPDRTCGDDCCTDSEECHLGQCCSAEQICGDSCCAGDQLCHQGACCAPENICEEACCSAGQNCTADGCCESDRVCGDACCAAGDACFMGICCPQDRVCGESCCAAGEVCDGGLCVPGCDDYLLDCQSSYNAGLKFDGPAILGSGDLPQDGEARDILAGFIDNDRNLDVAVLHGGGISVFLGDGQGGLAWDLDLSIEDADPYYLLAGDLDSDGSLDLVVFAGKPDIHFRVYLRKASGLVVDEYDLPGRQPVVTFAGMKSRPGLGDIHGDGDLDLVYLANGQEGFPVPERMINRGDGVFDLETVVLEGYDEDRNTIIGQGDFNGDGVFDLALSHYPSNRSVDVFLGDAQGGYQMASVNPYGGGADTPVKIVSGDYNNDGHTDIRTLHESCYDQLMIGNGDGTFQQAQVFHTGMDPTFRQAFGDFNADGNQDMAVSGYGPSISYLVMSPQGTVTQEINQSYWDVAGSEPILAAGDFNNDCIDDVVFAARDGSYQLAVFVLKSDPCDRYPDE